MNQLVEQLETRLSRCTIEPVAEKLSSLKPMKSADSYDTIVVVAAANDGNHQERPEFTQDED